MFQGYIINPIWEKKRNTSSTIFTKFPRKQNLPPRRKKLHKTPKHFLNLLVSVHYATPWSIKTAILYANDVHTRGGGGGSLYPTADAAHHEIRSTSKLSNLAMNTSLSVQFSLSPPQAFHL